MYIATVWIVYIANNEESIEGVFSSEAKARSFLKERFKEHIGGMRQCSDSDDFTTGTFWKIWTGTHIHLEKQEVQ